MLAKPGDFVMQYRTTVFNLSFKSFIAEFDIVILSHYSYKTYSVLIYEYQFFTTILQKGISSSSASNCRSFSIGFGGLSA